MSDPTDDEELPSLPSGTVLEDRYRIVEEIGVGGIGRVYRAEHLKLGHDVAIKALLPQYAAHEMMRPRFEREAKALASLQHPHIVTLIDYSIAKDGAPYLVMELLSGKTLDALLDEGPMPEAVARHVAVQAVEALLYAHGQGFVHRDLKPANIFLNELPTDPHHVKLLDFGFVKLLSAEATGQTVLTQSGIAFGTPSYMSPEQATGDTMDARTDVYSFGVILYEMIAGRRPYVGSLPEIVRQHLTAAVPPLSAGGRPIAATPELETLLSRAMAKEKSGRFESADELRDALLALPTPWVSEQAAALEPTMLAGLTSAQPTKPARPLADLSSSNPLASNALASDGAAAHIDHGAAAVQPVPSRLTPDAPTAPARDTPTVPPRASRGGLGLGLLLVAAASAAAVWWFGIRPASMAEAGLDSLRTAMGSEPTQTPSGVPDGEPDEPLPAPDTDALASLLDELSGDPWLSEPDEQLGADESEDDEALDEPTDNPEEAPPELPDSVPDPAPTTDAPEPTGGEVDPQTEDPPAEPETEPAGEEPALEVPAEEPPEEGLGEDEESEEDDPLGPNPWRTRAVNATLVRARRRVLGGHSLSRATTDSLRQMVRRDRGDPRPHLLIAQSFVADGRGATALERYDLAHRVDETAKGDPRMLFDLIRLATEEETRSGATTMLGRVYGEDALPFLDELLADESVPAERATALRGLRDNLEGETPTVGDTTSRQRRVRRRRPRARRRGRRTTARRRRARRGRRSRARRARRRRRRR